MKTLVTVLKTAQLINFTLTVMKFLALSEYSHQLYCAGVWVSCGWNILSLLLVRVLRKHLQPSPEAQDYSTLVNEEPSSSPTAPGPTNEQAASNGHTPNGQSRSEEASDKAEKDKKKDEEADSDSRTNMSTLKMIILLTKYSLYYWKWVLTATTFTASYALGELLNTTPIALNSSPFLISVQALEPFYTAIVDTIVSGTGGSSVASLLLVLLGIVVFSTLFDAVRSSAVSYAAALVANKIRKDLFAAITQQEIGFSHKGHPFTPHQRHHSHDQFDEHQH